MRAEIEFLKMSGAGNDFLLVDNMQSTWSVDWTSFARAVCSRPFGVGADGILVLEPSDHAAFRMQYFNADGSYGGMCGNGGRCVARYAFERGISGNSVLFEACGRMYEGIVHGELVMLRLPDIHAHPVLWSDQTVEGESDAWFLDTGSPHVVIKTDSIEDIDVVRTGRVMRSHPRAGPAGTNVNFYRREQGTLVLRTYERGVEAETFACGTGAVATAIVSAMVDGTPSPVRIRVRSGEDLVVSFRSAKSGYTGLSLEGSAHFVFAGSVTYDASTGKLGPVLLQVGGQGP